MRFNPLDHPILFSQIRWLSSASAWLEHTPFAMLLIDLLRPSTFVELGTHAGVSYCAFCQAVLDLKLPTKCFAIDTWVGDAHTHEYSENVLKLLGNYHDPLYGAFSTLVQKTFDEALNDFADGSIDLLHIDGLHTYDAVKHDYESWLPKLSDTAVVLFHDTAETKGDFGVYKLWEELSSNHPSFEFKHGHGLGILAVGKNPPPAMLEFLEDANANPEVFRKAFTMFGARDALKPQIQGVVRVLYHQQLAVNRWKRKVGIEVAPNTEDMRMALLHPIVYAQAASVDVLKMAQNPKRPIKND